MMEARTSNRWGLRRPCKNNRWEWLPACVICLALLCAPGAAAGQDTSQQNRTVPQDRRPSPSPTVEDEQLRQDASGNQEDRIGRQDERSAVDSRRTTTGTVVSSSRNTMVVRTEDGRHILFTFERYAERPETVRVGSRVRVVSRETGEGMNVASYVDVTSEGSGAQGQAGTAQQGTGEADPVPPEIRRIENQIERQMRRFRAGVRAGVGLDPEIVMAGVHANLGPFFHPDVWFRPNAEYGFGEVTKQFNLNFEAIYRLPVTERQGRWTMYAGAGPGFQFINRDFEAAQEDDRDIDFNDFDFEAGLNFLVGMENRNGMFIEFKGTAHSSPQVRFLVGYTF